MDLSSTREEVKNEITMDPMHHFPSEISISIIQAALPSDETYSTSLLDLTNVSQRWQNVLLCTPVLWSKLYIDETQPDFLALLSLSIQLAEQSSLKVILFGPVHDWTGLDRLLPPAYEQVTSVAVMMTRKEASRWHTEECYYPLSAFFDHFRLPPNLRDLVIDHRLTPSLSWLASYKLPPTVRLVGNCGLTVPSISRIRDSERLFDKVKYNIIRHKRDHTDHLNHLRPLLLSYHSPFTLSTEAHLPLSKYLANPLNECDSFEQLICTVASNLCSLTLSINLNFIGDLVDCLQELCSLQALALSIERTGRIQSQKLNRTDVVIPTLQGLKFTIRKESFAVAWDEDLAVELFEFLTRLYPCIQEVSLDASSWPSDKLSSLESLSILKDLRMNLQDMLSPSVKLSINLPSVQSLRLDNTSPLGDLTAPNLRRLTLKDRDLTAQFSINTQNLYYLVVCIGYGRQGKFYLDPTTFPSIKKLRLECYVKPTQWKISSFLHLVSIDLVTEILFNNPLGESLCLHLIYYPDSCPSLQELSSNRCFEWDLLFLTLQQRNFGRKNVRKIQTVTMPFVPFAFREHLELLLAGEHSEGPSYISQTLEETREVMFDANILGCYCCIKNQRPNCTQGCNNGIYIDWNAEKLYPKLEKPPDTTAPEIRDHILWHEALVEEWKKCYMACRFHRETACDRWL